MFIKRFMLFTACSSCPISIFTLKLLWSAILRVPPCLACEWWILDFALLRLLDALSFPEQTFQSSTWWHSHSVSFFLPILLKSSDRTNEIGNKKQPRSHQTLPTSRCSLVHTDFWKPAWGYFVHIKLVPSKQMKSPTHLIWVSAEKELLSF